MPFDNETTDKPASVPPRTRYTREPSPPDSGPQCEVCGHFGEHTCATIFAEPSDAVR